MKNKIGKEYRMIEVPITSKKFREIQELMCAISVDEVTLEGDDDKLEELYISALRKLEKVLEVKFVQEKQDGMVTKRRRS